MPTVAISSAPLTVPQRRAVAVRITRWFADRGVEPSHVVVRFDAIEPAAVFSGGVPVEALPGGGTGLQAVAVTCLLGPDRDDTFRASLAAHIAGTLGMTAQTALFYLEFRTTSPHDVFLATAGTLRRADTQGEMTG